MKCRSTLDKTELMIYNKVYFNYEGALSVAHEYEAKVMPDEAYVEEETSSSGLVENLEAIKKLKELLDLGAITQSEYEEKKKELLSLCGKTSAKKNKYGIWLWASLGFTIFSYIINVIISLDVGGNLFWMFDYILYGYIAGFICMGVGIAFYIASFVVSKRDKEAKTTRVVSLALMVALLCFTFSPLVFHEPCTYSSIPPMFGSSSTYSVTSCEYRRKNVKISSTHKGTPVTNIGYGAFSAHQKLKKIQIPDSITSIEGSAFSQCINLTSIVIPDSVTYIGERVFVGCDSITIFCESPFKPDGWADGWNCTFDEYGNPDTQNWRYATVYWGNEWEYDWRGNPTLVN